MDDPSVYLEKISAFSRMLRLEGLSVSPKETADASQILITLGVENREQMKIALRTVFAKSREEQLIFQRVFDGFFISEEAMRQQAEESAKEHPRGHMGLQVCFQDHSIGGPYITGIQKVPISIRVNKIVHLLQVDLDCIRSHQSVSKLNQDPLFAAVICAILLACFSHIQNLGLVGIINQLAIDFD